MKILLFGLGLIGCSEEKTDETEEIQEVEGVVYEYYDAYSLITLEHSGMQFKLSKHTVRNYRNARTQIGKLMEGLLLEELNDRTAQEIVEKLQRKYAPRTVQLHVMTLRQILNWDLNRSQKSPLHLVIHHCHCLCHWDLFDNHLFLHRPTSRHHQCLEELGL